MFKPNIISQSAIRDNAILIVDVDYRDDYAAATGIIIDDWESSNCATINVKISSVEPYEAGQFYKRELPCILEVLKHVTVNLGCIVVDSYVYLGKERYDGLGAKLYHETKIPVIGVAKTYFEGTSEDTFLYRGESKSPLYVTSIGGHGQDAAKECIKSMAGDFRIPGMLKYADHLCRTTFK